MAKPRKKRTAFLLRELRSLADEADVLKKNCFDNDHYEAHVDLSNAEPHIHAAIRKLEEAL